MVCLQYADQILIQNNLFYDNSGHAIFCNGFKDWRKDIPVIEGGCSNMKAYHNTIAMAQNSTSAAFYFLGSWGPIALLNNIMIDSYSTGYGIWIESTRDYGFISSDYNALNQVYYHQTNDRAVASSKQDVDEIHRLKLSEWQSFQKMNEKNSFSGNLTLFKAPNRGDWTLAPLSPGIDKGTVIPEISLDLRGNPRAQGASAHAGAFEQK